MGRSPPAAKLAVAKRRSDAPRIVKPHWRGPATSGPSPAFRSEHGRLGRRRWRVDRRDAQACVVGRCDLRPSRLVLGGGRRLVTPSRYTESGSTGYRRVQPNIADVVGDGG
jgi:hypothetical protein